MNTSWRFTALDTLFFRDGTPFHQGETGNILPGSLFPPPITTLQGAIRTALARSKGWIPGKDWPAELGTPNDLGQLRLAGPYLRYAGERLYPIPSLYFGEKGKTGWEIERLVPGSEVECDLGKVRLPMFKQQTQRKRGLLDLWVTQEGLEAVLQGRFPTSPQMLEHDQLWKDEQRIGIMRDYETRVAKDQHLYSLSHVRPQAKLEVEVEVWGIPEDCNLEEIQFVPLGGEGRFARVHLSEISQSFPRMPELIPSQDGQIRFTVSLLTPGRYEDPNLVVRSGPPGVPGRCISASIGKAMQIGGWDLVKKKPRKLTPLLPPGSTWFFEAEAHQLEEIRQVHGLHQGEQTEYGMGQLVVGIWKEEEED